MAVVGFVGPGQLGAPMVRRLLAAGHHVRVYARRPDVRDDLRAAGATVVDSGRAAAESASVVLACLFDDAQLRAVCEGPDGVLAGLSPAAVLASHVTGRRETLAELAGRTAAAVVDAPVSGGADDIAAGRLTVLLGGADAAVSAVADVVAAYASPVVRTGGPGSALAVKLVNNLLFAAHVQLVAEAADVAAHLGVERELLLPALGACSGSSYAASTLARFPDLDAFAALAGPFLRKDVAAGEAQLAAAGGDAGLLGEVVRRGRLPLTDPVPLR